MSCGVCPLSLKLHAKRHGDVPSPLPPDLEAGGPSAARQRSCFLHKAALAAAILSLILFVVGSLLVDLFSRGRAAPPLAA